MDMVSPVVKRWQYDAARDPDRFWDRAARKLNWFRTWDQVLDWQPPTFRWFVGGLTNLSYNCLDYHVERGWGGHAALIALNERDERRVYTYAQLLSGVESVAAALRGLGVQRGDRVAIYMPTMPEAMMAMLTCARIGAIHLVVFAGFGSHALAERAEMAGARVLLAADRTWRKGREVNLWDIVRDALQEEGSPIEHVVVLPRGDALPALQPGRDITWDEFIANGRGQSSAFELMESNEPVFVLATSGTTAKPKLNVHNHGPFQVYFHSMGQWCYDLKPTDVWWSTSDIGWIVGHSYITYGPLLFGATTIAYEGALDHPGPETLYRVIAENGVSALWTAPTAVRMLMARGTEPARAFDLRSIERVFCAGEVLNIPAWEWFQKEVFDDRVPVLDHMWQTETSGPLFGNPYGIDLLPIKPGSAGIPMPGIFAEIRTMEGEPCSVGEKGIVVVTRPFPGLTPTIWGEPERYGREYWDRIPGVYFTGDAASIDEDGYVWFSGRADEIIKIAGHRIGTVEVETAFLRHPAVAEAGVTGRPDELRGEVISAFVVLKPGFDPSEELERELRETVRRELGAVVVISDINIVHMLPKSLLCTLEGEMRRLRTWRHANPTLPTFLMKNGRSSRPISRS